MKIIAQAPGKLILLGEYAVLAGAPALATAIDRFARVSIQPANRPHFLLNIPTLGISDLPFSIHQQGQVEFRRAVDDDLLRKLRFFVHPVELAGSILSTRSRKFPPLKIKLEMKEFFAQPENMKLGIGSSASLTVALLAALLYFDGTGPLDHDDLMQKALNAHRRAQGNVGSGVDIAASVYGGVFRFNKSPKDVSFIVRVERQTLPPDLHIRCIWTGKSASTRKLVQTVYRFKQAYPSDYQDLISRLTQLSADGCRAFSRNDIQAFLTIVQQYYQQLLILGQKSQAPIISHEHHQLTEIIHRAGGSYKPSGAGGGDLGLAFGQRASVMQKITHEVNSAGFQIVDLKTGAPGVQIKRLGENNEVFSNP